MRKEQFAAFQDWFNSYVGAFYQETPGFQSWIELKDNHTRRVGDIIIRIGRSLDLPEEDLLLAGTIALFHDVGRFKQVHLYGTFNDRRSENHATLGIRVLAESAVLDGISQEEADIIIKAIELHNLRELPGGLPKRLHLFARLIQDADKLDILELFTCHYGGESGGYGAALDSHLPDTPGYSADLVEDILQEKLGNYKDVKNRNDRKLLHLSWIYGIHFRFTLSELERNGYVEKIIAVLPGDEVTRKVYQLVKSHIAGNH